MLDLYIITNHLIPLKAKRFNLPNSSINDIRIHRLIEPIDKSNGLVLNIYIMSSWLNLYIITTCLINNNIPLVKYHLIPLKNNIRITLKYNKWWAI